MKRYVLIIVMIVCSNHAASMGVYVCTDARGNKEYKNQPAEGCETVNLEPISALKKPKAKKTSLEPTKSVSLGMKKSDVEKIWGAPELKRRVQNRKGITEEWTYRHHGKLAFQDGVLEVIED